MIKVAHYCNQLGLGGTEKTMELFCKYLDSNRFEVFVVSKIPKEPTIRRIKVFLGCLLRHQGALARRQHWNTLNSRRKNFEKLIKPNHLFFAKNDHDLKNILLKIQPDILHVHYSGNNEAPTNNKEILSKIPVTVTTNQFEKENNSDAHRLVKKMFFVSNWLLKNKATWVHGDSRADVMYNPIEVPCTNGNLRSELGIPDHAFVVGRVGRPDAGIHDPISLKAYRKIETSNTYFVALSPPINMVRQAKNLNLKNFIALPPNSDPVFLSKFYNTINVLAHARRDGETFGCNLAEAMIHGKPVISHLTSFMNAQTEVIGDGGFVCEQDDWESYAEKLLLLRDNPLEMHRIGGLAQKRALKNFEIRSLIKRLENVYLELLKKD